MHIFEYSLCSSSELPAILSHCCLMFEPNISTSLLSEEAFVSIMLLLPCVNTIWLYVVGVMGCDYVSWEHLWRSLLVCVFGALVYTIEVIMLFSGIHPKLGWYKRTESVFKLIALVCFTLQWCISILYYWTPELTFLKKYISKPNIIYI